MKKDIMDVSVSSMSESPRHENPEENAHEKIRGDVTVVKSEPTSEEFAAESIGRDPAVVVVEPWL